MMRNAAFPVRVTVSRMSKNQELAKFMGIVMDVKYVIHCLLMEVVIVRC